MKVVVINGSYHQNGVTSFLVDKFVQGIEYSNKDAVVKEYRLVDEPIELCKACGCCIRNDGKKIGECPQPDFVMVKKIIRDMLDCDILVYATPVYEKAVTALLKRFMERTMAVLYMGKAGPVRRNAVNKNKIGVVLITCGTPFPMNIIQGITKYTKGILPMFCKSFGCNKVESIEVPGMGSKEDVNDKYAKKIHSLAIKLGNNFAS